MDDHNTEPRAKSYEELQLEVAYLRGALAGIVLSRNEGRRGGLTIDLALPKFATGPLTEGLKAITGQGTPIESIPTVHTEVAQAGAATEAASEPAPTGEFDHEKQPPPNPAPPSPYPRQAKPELLPYAIPDSDLSEEQRANRVTYRSRGYNSGPLIRTDDAGVVQKMCARCYYYKNVDDYAKNAGNKDKLSSYCKSCAAENSRIWSRNKRIKEGKEEAVPVLRASAPRITYKRNTPGTVCVDCHLWKPVKEFDKVGRQRVSWCSECGHKRETAALTAIMQGNVDFSFNRREA